MMKKISSGKICFYGVLTAAAMLFGYIESLFPLDFIAPGIKLGLANLLPLYLILIGKKTGALAVNIIRIFLTAIIFGSPFSLIYSLSAGIISPLVMILISRIKYAGVIGISLMGSLAHNITQILVAMALIGKGVVFYLPFLIIAGLITGSLIGLVAYLLLKNKELNKILNLNE